jgi:hypothetical protein
VAKRKTLQRDGFTLLSGPRQEPLIFPVRPSSYSRTNQIGADAQAARPGAAHRLELAPRRIHARILLISVERTPHPADIPRESTKAPANARQSPQATLRKAVLLQGVPVHTRPARKHQDRSVTPEVAGSSPVAPVACLPRNRSLPVLSGETVGAEPYEKYNGMPSALERPLAYLVGGV